MINDQALNSKDDLTRSIRERGIQDWETLTNFVRQIPYGRNASRTDFSLVITEHKGTCSSKHALLKTVANLNDMPNIELILGMYRMNAENTPGIGDAFTGQPIQYVPEAHCYLKINGQRLDYTNPTAAISRIEADILSELSIEPAQVGQFKVDYHQAFIKKWIREEGFSMTFEEAWAVREACIQNLSTSTDES